MLSFVWNDAKETLPQHISKYVYKYVRISTAAVNEPLHKTLVNNFLEYYGKILAKCSELTLH